MYPHGKKMTPENFQFKCNTQRGGGEQTDRNGVLEKLGKIFKWSYFIVQENQDTITANS